MFTSAARLVRCCLFVIWAYHSLSVENGLVCPESNDPWAFFRSTAQLRFGSAIWRPRQKKFWPESCECPFVWSRGRTVKKIKDFDVGVVFCFAPDVVISEIGTNDLWNISAEVVGSEIDDLVKQLLSDFSVQVVGVCLVIPRAEALFNQKVKLLNRYFKCCYWQPPCVSMAAQNLGRTQVWFSVARRCSFESLRTVFTVPELPRCNFTGCEAFGSVRVRVTNANYQDKLVDFSFK